MKKQLICLITGITLVLSACTAIQRDKQNNLDISEERALSSFNKLRVQGNVEVKLLAGLEKHDLRLIGNRFRVAEIDAQVVDNTLIITQHSTYKSKYKDKVHLVIRTNQLEELDYRATGDLTAIDLNYPIMDVILHTNGNVDLRGEMGIRNLSLAGSGKIKIHELKSHDLKIMARGSNQVDLTGVANLQRVDFAGNGKVNLYWVEGKEIEIVGREYGTLQLAGRADTIVVNLHGNAHFDGQYLRADKAYVKTYNASRADLQVREAQNTLALDNSNIYYYKKPHVNAVHMADSGSVLNANGMK